MKVGGSWRLGRAGSAWNRRKCTGRLRLLGLLWVAVNLLSAGQASAASIQVGAASVRAGETATIAVTWTGEPGLLTSLQFDLTFPAHWFEVAPVNRVAPAGESLAVQEMGPGVLRLTFSGPAVANLRQGPLVELQVAVAVATPDGFYPLRLANLVASGVDGAPVAVAPGPGVLQVGADAEPLPRLIFTQFADGTVGSQPNRTRVILWNPSSEPESGEVRFRGSEGSPAEVVIDGVSGSRHRFTIPAGGTRELTTEGMGTLQTGSVEVVSDLGEASRIEGGQVLEILGSFVSVGPASPGDLHLVYVSHDGLESTGIAVYNPDRSGSARLRAHLVDSEGVWRASTWLELGAGEQIARFVSEPEMFGDFLQGLSEFRGTLNLVTDGTAKVSVLGLLQKTGSGALIAIPVGVQPWDRPEPDPEVTITGPVSGQELADRLVIVTGTASAGVFGVRAVSVRVNGGEWRTANGTTSWNLAVTLSAGVNLIEARAEDHAGNYSTVTAVTVTLNPPDTTAPQVAITSPTSGQTVESPTLTVAGTASDADSGVKAVSVRVNGGEWRTSTGTANWSIVVTLVAGANTIEARAEDQAGNYSTVEAVTVTWNPPDTTAPQVTITSPTSGQTMGTQTVTVTGTASDADSGVKAVAVRVNGGEWRTATGTVNWSFVVTLAAGENTIEARAEDVEGNFSDTASVSVTWNPPDETAPQVSITGPTEGATIEALSVTVIGTASSTGSEIRRVWIRVNSGGSWQQAEGTVNWSRTVTLREGTNKIEARAETQNGRFSAVSTVSVVGNPPDTTAPEVAISNPAPGQNFGVPGIVVTGTASDAGSGVRAVAVRVNGGDWQTASGTTDWSRNVTLREGANTIEARAEDHAGNLSATRAVSVSYTLLDSTPPQVTITIPAAGVTVAEATITVRGTASDIGSGVREVTVRVNGGSWLKAEGTTNWVRVVNLASGANTVEARAEDNAGNYSELRSVWFSYAGPVVEPGAVYATDSVVGPLRLISGGRFAQGSGVPEPCRELAAPGSETLFIHLLTGDLAVMETEVTRQMWADLQSVQPALPADPTVMLAGSGMDNPVQNLTWYEAVLFANLLSAQQGLVPAYYVDPGFSVPVSAATFQSSSVMVNWEANGYRLPTEGEWEYFTRAGTTTPFWIPEPNYTALNCNQAPAPGMYPALDGAAWLLGNSAIRGTSAPVGTRQPNPWNLFDVHGNVWEWTWDWYGIYPAGTRTDYRGPALGSHRVIRGGSWSSYALSARSALRAPTVPSDRSEVVGFRLVRSVR